MHLADLYQRESPGLCSLPAEGRGVEGPGQGSQEIKIWSRLGFPSKLDLGIPLVPLGHTVTSRFFLHGLRMPALSHAYAHTQPSTLGACGVPS